MCFYKLFNHHPALPGASGRRFSRTVSFDQSPEEGVSQCGISLHPWQAPDGCCCTFSVRYSLLMGAACALGAATLQEEQRTACACLECLHPSCHTLFCAHLPEPPGDARAGPAAGPRGLEELDSRDRAVSTLQGSAKVMKLTEKRTCVIFSPHASHVRPCSFFFFFCFTSVLAPQLVVL